ncbi:MAG: hypothetical protein EXR86_03420 [Gammaproteobacteria bacterium]|nr:hypothetical protein [Gammaproteobacteria bacterium]
MLTDSCALPAPRRRAAARLSAAHLALGGAVEAGIVADPIPAPIAKRVLTKALLFLAGALCLSNASGLTIGQIDDFEDGTTQGWTVGNGFNPNPPTNVATDGPNGVNDAFLRLTSSGTGSGGKLTAFNLLGQWAGNYAEAGITLITMDVRNAGASTLSLRLGFVDFTQPNSALINNFAISTNGITIDADNLWHSIEFSLLDLSATIGSVNGALESVDTLRIFHNSSPASPGPSIVAELGIDNITAVPLPAAFWLLGSGVVLVGVRARRRCDLTSGRNQS